LAKWSVHENFEQLFQSAATNGNSAAIEILLSKIAISPTAGRSALISSAAAGSADAVQLLLKKGFRADLQNEAGRTHFHYAAIRGHEEVATAFIGANISICDDVDNNGRTPLFWTVQMNCLFVAKVLFLAKADSNTKEVGGFYPVSFEKLDFARYSDSNASVSDSASKASASGSDSNAEEEYVDESRVDLISSNETGGHRPLFFAAGNGNHRMTKLLLGNHGANSNIQDKYGATALCWVAGQRCEITAKLVLDAEATPEPLGDSNQAPLLWAVGSQGGFINDRLRRGVTDFRLWDQGGSSSK
jgi:ankyrin repeat protein